MARTVKLVPTTGKYVSVSYKGKAYEVWKVNPVTGSYGTDVDYNAAVQLLCIQPPVVALLPVISGGKHVKQLDDKDIQLIDEAQMSARTVDVSEENTTPNSFGSTETVDYTTLQSEMQEMRKMLQQKDREMETMKGQIKRLQDKGKPGFLQKKSDVQESDQD